MAFTRIVSSKEIMEHPWTSLSALDYMLPAQKAYHEQRVAKLRKQQAKIATELSNAEAKIKDLDARMANDPQLGVPNVEIQSGGPVGPVDEAV